MEKSFHRGLKKLSFSVGSVVYQLCHCGHVVSSSWLIFLHLQHDIVPLEAQVDGKGQKPEIQSAPVASRLWLWE